ncbi:MAG: APC family permease [Devosia sp.]
MAERGGHLRRALGFWDLVLFGLICIAPVAGFTLYGFVSNASGGSVVLPYVLGAIGLGFTGLSYASMAEIAPQAGSVYGFARLAMGRFIGFVGGWAIMLDYVVIGALVLLYGAIYLNAVMPAVPVPVLIGVFGAFGLGINLMGIRMAAWVDILLAGLQVAVALAFIVGALLLGGQLSAAPAWPEGTTLQGVVAATPLAVIAFLGFDAVSTLSEEVAGREPGRLVGRATIATLAVMLLLFVSVSWLLSSLSVGLTLADPATAGMDIVAARLPWLGPALALVVALAYGFGLAPAINAGVSRLGYAMARAGELPGFLAHIDSGRQVPAASVAFYGLLLALIAWVALPAADVLAGLVSFGAIAGFILVNLSVIVRLGIHSRSRRWFRHWLSPILGIAVLLWVLTGILPQALMLGLAWLVAGVIWYWIRRLLQRTFADAQGGVLGVDAAPAQFPSTFGGTDE